MHTQKASRRTLSVNLSKSHDSIKYSIVTGELSVDTPEGNQRLADPSQFVGHVGDADNPNSIFSQRTIYKLKS
ncbi:MAG: hypothetical protein CM15mP49_03040 [Actinomycetota bacterium]|nr:MAG: hypothetical protein CM15mP49_03040 [Actinomycetota bacterium]